MSDDTPTQRFPSPENGGGGNDLPTQRLESVSEELVDERKKSNALLIVLIILGALLLAGIIVVAVFLLGRNSTPIVAGTDSPTTTSPAPSDTPSASTTPSATPSESSTTAPPPPPPPPSTDVKIDSFSVSPKTVFCNTQAQQGVNTNQYLHFTWKTSNADTITIDADVQGSWQGMFYNLPPDGNSDDSVGSTTITYFCPQASQKWRLDVTGSGKTVYKEINIVNTGDTQ